jgi:hypothetical protein
MPLFGANGGLDSTSPATFDPLTARALRDMKIVTTLFLHTIFHSVAKGNRN